jgi:proline iminopeptidase
MSIRTFLAAIFFSLTVTFFVSAETDLRHPPGSFVTVNGKKLWVEIEGSGEPLILIAGGPGFSHAYYHPFFDELSKNHRVIYFDAFGCGRSDRAKNLREYTMAGAIDDVEGLRKALGIGRADILGHSYGGFVAELYALKYPTSIRRLILANTAASGVEYQTALTDHNRDVANQFPEVWANVLKLRKRGFLASSKEMQTAFDVPGTLHNFFNPENARKLPRTEQDLYNPDLWYSMAGPDADFTVTGEIRAFDARPGLRRIRIPVLVLSGRFDRNVPPRLILNYKKIIPSARLIIFENSGHFPFVEENKKVIDSIADFLRR